MRGIVLGQEGIDAAVIKIATEADLQRLVNGPREVNLLSSADRLRRSDLFAIDRQVYFRRVDGTFVVGFGDVTDIQVAQDHLDITSYGDLQHRFIEGIERTTFTFRGVI